jgi:hypothetical protein
MQTLSEQRKESYRNPDIVVCCSMTLYVLLERSPRPDCPEYVELACHRLNGAEGILLFQSPIDAIIKQGSVSRGTYQPYPFEAVDPRIFIQSHDGWLTLYVVYGFAAHNNKLLLDEDGFLCPLLYPNYIQFDLDDIPEHIHIDFSDGTLIDRLEKLHRSAGLSDYRRLVYEQAQSSMAELSMMAGAALRVADFQDAREHRATQCAIYDPIEAKWRFVDLEDVPQINR